MSNLRLQIEQIKAEKQDQRKRELDGDMEETKEQIKKLKFEKQDKKEQMQVNKKQIHLMQQQHERLSEKDAL